MTNKILVIIICLLLTTPVYAGREVSSGEDDSITNTSAGAAAAGRGTGTTWAVIGWFRSPDNSGGSDFARMYIESTSDGGGDDYCTVGLNQAGALQMFYRPGGFSNPAADITSATGFDDSVWHWIFIVCRADDDYEFYIDGSSEGTDSTTVTNSVTPSATNVNRNNNQTLPIGTNYGRWMNWQESLTIGEAKTAAYSGVIGKAPNLWWELGHGSPEPDWSGNGYNGTVNGSMPIGDSPPVKPPFGG